jgi:UDP-MurNAc hydroxylase
LTFELQFINHAGFSLRDLEGGVQLVSDPWLEGSAFDDGWDLLVPTTLEPGFWSDVTHLWFSHEHPDHFAPPSLKLIPDAVRPNIVVLYQETKDKRVSQWCERAGFQVQEFEEATWLRLSPKLRVMLGKVPFYDSWLAFDCDGRTVLNVNDCVLSTERPLHKLSRLVGPVDTLLTQFSYANWLSNPGDVASRTAAAAEKLEWLRRQIETLRPERTVPFASFMWFSHEENHYLNDERNTVATAAKRIKEASSEPVVLYPGDVWTLGEAWDSSDAIDKYEAISLEGRSLRSSPSVELAELIGRGRQYVERVFSKNNRFLVRAAARVGFLNRICLQLWDLDETVEFDIRTGLRQVTSATEAAQAQVAMHSESLGFILKHEWGMDTVSVNGRFRALQDDAYQKLQRAFSVSVLNNTGRAFSWSLLQDMGIIRRGIDKFIRK